MRQHQNGRLILDDSEREALSRRVQALIEAGRNEKGQLMDRWKRNKEYYDNVPFPFIQDLIGGAVDYPYPLIQPRLDALRDMVVGTICSQKPFMLAGVRGSNQRQEDLENTLQFFAELGRLEDALLEAAPVVGYTNAGIIRVQFVASVHDFLPSQRSDVQTTKTGQFSFMGLAFDVIHPEDFICVGSNIFGINNAQAVGHRFWLQRQQIKELQKAKLVDEVDVVAGTPEQNISDRDVDNAVTAYANDDKVECWELIFRCSFKDYDTHPDDKAKGNEEYYKVQFAVDTQEILSLEKYQYSRPWYACLRYKPKPHNSFWNGASVAQDLQGLHVQYQQMNNAKPWAVIANMLPPMFIKGAPYEKDRKYRFGEVIGLEGAEISFPNLKVDINGIDSSIMQVERTADATARISSAGLGQEFGKGDTTATEASLVASGQQAGVTGFIRVFSTGLTDLYEIMNELLYMHYDLWFPQYGQDIYNDRPFPAETFLLPVSFDVNGKSPSETPQQMAAKMQALLELSNSEQQASVEAVLAAVPELLMSILPPGTPPEVVEGLMQQLISTPGMPQLDRREIIRTFVNNIGINNADKILLEAGENGTGPMPSVGNASAVLGAQSGLPAQATSVSQSEPGY